MYLMECRSCNELSVLAGCRRCKDILVYLTERGSCNEMSVYVMKYQCSPT